MPRGGRAGAVADHRERHHHQPAGEDPDGQLDDPHAAEQLFLGRGFAATTIGDLSGAADVSIGSIYAHFGDKDGVYAALIDRTSISTTATARRGSKKATRRSNASSASARAT